VTASFIFVSNIIAAGYDKISAHFCVFMAQNDYLWFR